MVGVLGSQSSGGGSIPSWWLADKERDDNALKALLCDPPCRTCKKEQASDKLQDYLSGSLDLIYILKASFRSSCFSGKLKKIFMQYSHFCLIGRQKFAIFFVQISSIFPIVILRANALILNELILENDFRYLSWQMFTFGLLFILK